MACCHRSDSYVHQSYVYRNSFLLCSKNDSEQSIKAQLCTHTPFHDYINSSFPSHTLRFHELVSDSFSEDSQPLSLVDTAEEFIEYEYEVDEKSGERVILGRGSFGTVYSAIDVVTKKKMAVKEIREDASG